MTLLILSRSPIFGTTIGCVAASILINLICPTKEMIWCLSLPFSVKSFCLYTLWHEISVRFLLWGSLYAIAISIWYKYEGTILHQKLSAFPYLQKTLGIFITIHFVMFSFVLTMEDSLGESIELYSRLFFI